MVNIFYTQISVLEENLSKVSTLVVLHEWSDDEKMTFAWIFTIKALL